MGRKQKHSDIGQTELLYVLSSSRDTRGRRVLDAETRIGELLTTHVKAGSHEQKIPDEITRHQSSQYQQMAEHKDMAEALLDAETRIGELLKGNPPTSLRNEVGQLQGKRPLPEGISWNQPKFRF